MRRPSQMPVIEQKLRLIQVDLSLLGQNVHRLAGALADLTQIAREECDHIEAIRCHLTGEPLQIRFGAGDEDREVIA